MRERYRDEVKESDKLNLSKASRDALASDDVKEQLRCLRLDLVRNKITSAQFEQLAKTIVTSSDADIKALLHDVEELKSLRDNS